MALTEPGDAAAPQTLRDYLVLALERNPDIRAAVAEARRRAARVPQVTALPDPMVSMKVLPEPTRTAEGDNFFMLGVRQTLPVPEKLDRRGRIALEETRIALADLEQTRLRVVADLEQSIGLSLADLPAATATPTSGGAP